VVPIVRIIRSGWVSVHVVIVEVNSHSLAVITDDVEGVFGETHVCYWGVDYIRDRVNQVELVLSPQNNRDVTITACEQNIAFWVSFQRVYAVESGVLAVSSVVDHFGIFVEGQRA
jgi:hypothetical protein